MTDTTNTQTKRPGPMERWLLMNELHMHYVKDKDTPYGDRSGMAVVDQLAAIKPAREVDAQLREAIAQRDSAEANAQNLSRLRAEAEKRAEVYGETSDGLYLAVKMVEARADRLAEALLEEWEAAHAEYCGCTSELGQTCHHPRPAALAGEPAGEA